MIIHFLIFIVSLVLLAKGADFFVEYAARLAGRLGVSEFVIGLTLTSIGTSIPELAAAVSASMEGSSGLIVGNVVGSNIANIGLIMGIAALISSFATDRKMFQRDGYIMLAGVILFLGFSLDNEISRLESVSLLLLYVAYLLFLIRSDKSEEGRYRFHHFLDYVFEFGYLASVRDTKVREAVSKEPHARTEPEQEVAKGFAKKLAIELGVVILAGLAIMVGAHFLVDEAIWLAHQIGVPESVIGLSMVAIGTSLPELSVSITAARKGKGNLVIGNVLGSNIANVMLIIGVAGLIRPLEVAENSVAYTIPIMLFFSLALLYFIRSNWSIGRKEGIISTVAYVIFLTLAFLLGWG